MTFFFFNDTATTEIYTLSLHDALPISPRAGRSRRGRRADAWPLRRTRCPRRRSCRPAPAPRDQTPSPPAPVRLAFGRDRKSTRLNSSHANISYAVFCLKKKYVLYYVLI